MGRAVGKVKCRRCGVECSSAHAATVALLGLPGFIAPSSAPALPGRVALADGDRPALRPTAHPPIPRDLEALWLVPAGAAARGSPPPKDAAARDLAAAVDLIVAGEVRRGVAAADIACAGEDRRSPTTSPITSRWRGSAPARRLRLATGSAGCPAARVPGVLGEWALLGEAMASEQLGQPAEAARLFEIIAERKPEKPTRCWPGSDGTNWPQAPATRRSRRSGSSITRSRRARKPRKRISRSRR